ncbi:Dethiobiotin synthetase, partial [hydrothermal vent metagenome]
MHGIFITGSDTNVGKTYIGCQIANTLNKHGIKVIPRKPIETGCTLVNGILQPHDAQLLLSASKAELSLDEVCPYRYQPAVSPHIAATKATMTQAKILTSALNNSLTLSNLVNACRYEEKEGGFLIVEGAGGIYSPICEHALNADLAIALKLPIVLVVKDKLGAINQSLLAVNAAQQQQLNIHAIVLTNHQNTIEHESLNNAAEIRKYTQHAVYN